jgi:hypothetical protein
MELGNEVEGLLGQFVNDFADQDSANLDTFSAFIVVASDRSLRHA